MDTKIQGPDRHIEIAFNLIDCGLANNGGSQTIIKSCETLNKLGVKSHLVSNINNFTWFKHQSPILRFPSTVNAVIATGQGTVKHTAKLNIDKKFWWIRGHEDWWLSDQGLLKLYNIPNIINITNSHGLKKRIENLGCNQPCHVVHQGMDLDLWEDLNLRKNNKKIRIGCLHTKQPLKNWPEFQKLAKSLDRNKYEFVGVGSSPARDSFLSEFITNATKPQLKNLYSSCDIWFAPTKNEGLHNVPMEASLCGALIVCSNRNHNGMIHDYAFHNKSAFVYSNLEEAISIIETKKREDNLNIIKESQKIIENNIGSRYHNMKKLIELITKTHVY
jgi:hypothetical protein